MLGHGHELFGAGEGQLHRPAADLPGQGRYQRLDAYVSFSTVAASQGWDDHAYVLGLDAEQLGQHRAHEEGRLRRGPHCEISFLAPLSGGDVRLQRHVLGNRAGESLFDDLVRRRKASVHVAAS